VEVIVAMTETDGVKVSVFATGWKGVRVAGPEKGMTVFGTEITVMVEMKGR
jgi:hypothetical protein